MLLAHGFLKKIFEIFEKYETAIDMITTSEIAVSLTIDDNTYLTEITSELLKFAQEKEFSRVKSVQVASESSFID